MVKRGLKKGATFVDGGNTYKVVKVLPDGNYISKRVTSATGDSDTDSEDSETEKKEETKEDTATADK